MDDIGPEDPTLASVRTSDVNWHMKSTFKVGNYGQKDTNVT